MSRPMKRRPRVTPRMPSGLLKAAGRSIFQFTDPMVNTPEQALARAGVHAQLAVYYLSLPQVIDMRVNPGSSSDEQ